ncbi:hypothetical protein [Priestia megaterium]|uniref:hypothetical protein n=1 Tax=Priestia megaterium TaxID=1404 RepID=UPI00301CF4C3
MGDFYARMLRLIMLSFLLLLLLIQFTERSTSFNHITPVLNKVTERIELITYDQ